MSFVQNPIPTYSQSQMLTMLPPSGSLYFFYNSDQENALYSVDSAGNFSFISDADGEDCCTCEIFSQILCTLDKALNKGIMTPAQYSASLVSGLKITQTKTSPGNCTVGITYLNQKPTTISVSPSTATINATGEVQLGTSATPAGASPLAYWVVTSGGDFASVDQTGNVSGKAAGTAVVTAYSVFDNSIKDTATITITS